MRHALAGRWMRQGLVLGLAAMMVLGIALAAFAQAPLAIRELKARFPTLKKEVVLVQGWVTSEKTVPQTTFHGYYVRDRFGDVLLVRTTKELPGINTEVRVKGVAFFDEELKELFIVEEARTSLQELKEGKGPTVVSVENPNGLTQDARDKVTLARKSEPGDAGKDGGAEVTLAANAPNAANAAAAAPPAAATAVTAPVPAAEKKGLFAWLTWPWVVGFSGAGVVLVLGALVMMTSKRRSAASSLNLDSSTADAWQNPYLSTTPAAANPADVLHQAPAAEVPTVEDYKTVKAFKTTKVLPGLLVVLDGTKETDTIHLSDQSGHGEIEIGRDSPDATGGIRIKDKTNTLSRRQAKILYTPASREFKLHNLVGDGGNPTAINGRLMHENEAIVLNDGDRLTMGSVDLLFRHK